MFICHKCGYKDLTETNKTHCPVCGENITVPKFALILFLSVVCFIIFTFLSFFNKKLGIILNISAVISVISLPLAIKEAVERSLEIKDGFRAADYPSEIINESTRVPDFKTFDYVYGFKDDDGIKKILFEISDDGLNYYHNKLNNTELINYRDIVGLELHEDNGLKMSAAKSIVYGALLGAIGGTDAGIIGGAIGGMGNKKHYVLEIQIEKEDEICSLYITSDKSKLINFAKDIELKVNKIN